MRESVSAVFVTKDSVYFIKRQNYLPIFPGYYATPGGKVDKTDKSEALVHSLWPSHVNPQILHALIREVKEELNFNLEEAILKGDVLSIDDIGVAITPEFNPYRFKNYYFKITLTHAIDFEIDANEAEFGKWHSPHELLARYETGEVLAVPPAIVLLKTFANNLAHNTPIEMSLPHDPETEVPMIESIFGVRQFLPLSNTFPPANRTNAFIIGDEGHPKLLIDPSPKDEHELVKFIRSIDKIGFDRIFLTHHHADHFQYARELAFKYKVGIDLSKDTFNRIGEEYFKDIQITFRKEGDVVTKSLGSDVVVFEVPGHDEGQLALAPNSMNWFLAGDLIQTIGTVAILVPEGNMKKYFETLKKVIAMKPKNIIPSHGIIVGGTHKLEETLKHRQMREDQVINLINQGKNLDEMVASIYVGLEEGLIPYAKRTIEAHLEKIRDDQKDDQKKY
jgi:ribonuclease/clavin/mitogillin